MINLKLCAFLCSFLCLIPSVWSKPLKVFILAGQSNMQGHAHVRTFEHIAMDPSMASLLSKMTNGSGEHQTLKDVWISCLGSSSSEKIGQLTVGYGAEKNGPKIGPEFTFGITMADHLQEPFLIIKTAWGGKSLHTDFRPPSAGPYVFNEQQLEGFEKQGKDIEEEKKKRAELTGHYYRLMVEHVQKVLGDIKRVYPGYDAKKGYELAGFVWFQGWNDMVDRGVYPKRHEPGGYGEYSKVLAHFIRDVRKEFSSPEMPFAIGVMGTGGDIASRPPNRYTPIHLGFREAMTAPSLLPEFKENVVAVQTYKCWDFQLDQLKEREGKLKNKERELKKDKAMTREKIREEVEKLKKELYTEKELEILKKGISNFGFHYHGSGKIMAKIGVAFAEGLLGLAKE